MTEQTKEKPVFHFDRYVDGVLMAEGVTIERQNNLASATLVAARIAPKGMNGRVPVLVLHHEPIARHLPQPNGDGLVERCRHGVRWPHPCDDCHADDMKPENLIARITNLEADLASLRADRDRLAGALERIASKDFDSPTGSVLAKHVRSALQYKDMTDGE